MAFIQMRENMIADRLHRRDDERAAQRFELRKAFSVLQNMLDLDGGIEGERGKLGVHGAQDVLRVAGTVQEVWVAKGDVLRAHLDLRANVLQNNLSGQNKETAPVDGRDGTMQASV